MNAAKGAYISEAQLDVLRGKSESLFRKMRSMEKEMGERERKHGMQ